MLPASTENQMLSSPWIKFSFLYVAPMVLFNIETIVSCGIALYRHRETSSQTPHSHMDTRDLQLKRIVWMMLQNFVSFHAGVYLHDPRIMSKDARSKTRRKNNEDIITDSLFWPVMPIQDVAQRIDSSRQPHVVQEYNVPYPKHDFYRRHDQAVYSLWMHFVQFCLLTAANERTAAGSSKKVTIVPQNEDFGCSSKLNVVNQYTQEERLMVFVELALGQAPTGDGAAVLRAFLRESTAQVKLQSNFQRGLCGPVGDLVVPFLEPAGLYGNNLERNDKRHAIHSTSFAKLHGPPCSPGRSPRSPLAHFTGAVGGLDREPGYGFGPNHRAAGAGFASACPHKGVEYEDFGGYGGYGDFEQHGEQYGEHCAEEYGEGDAMASYTDDHREQSHQQQQQYSAQFSPMNVSFRRPRHYQPHQQQQQHQHEFRLSTQRQHNLRQPLTQGYHGSVPVYHQENECHQDRDPWDRESLSQPQRLPKPQTQLREQVMGQLHRQHRFREQEQQPEPFLRPHSQDQQHQWQQKLQAQQEQLQLRRQAYHHHHHHHQQGRHDLEQDQWQYQNAEALPLPLSPIARSFVPAGADTGTDTGTGTSLLRDCPSLGPSFSTGPALAPASAFLFQAHEDIHSPVTVAEAALSLSPAGNRLWKKSYAAGPPSSAEAFVGHGNTFAHGPFNSAVQFNPTVRRADEIFAFDGFTADFAESFADGPWAASMSHKLDRRLPGQGPAIRRCQPSEEAQGYRNATAAGRQSSYARATTTSRTTSRSCSDDEIGHTTPAVGVADPWGCAVPTAGAAVGLPDIWGFAGLIDGSDDAMENNNKIWKPIPVKPLGARYVN